MSQPDYYSATPAASVAATPQPKPGYKTTEFWLGLFGTAASIVAASGWYPDTHPVIRIAGVVGTVLLPYRYMMVRENAKTTEP